MGKVRFSVVLALTLCLALFGSSVWAEGNSKAFEPYDPPIEMSWARDLGDSLANDIASKLDGERIEDNRWTRDIEARLGIKTAYQWIASSNEYEQKMNMAIAAGDLPDYFWVNQSQLRQLADADMLVDLKALYEEYAAPFTREILEAGGQAPFESATVDGKLLAIPEVSPMLDGYSYLWIREDWLENLGLEAPSTMDELIQVIEKFTHDDPDGNGENDTVGIVFDKSLYYNLNGFFAGFHAYPTNWVERDGQVVYGGIQPEVKQALGALQSLFANGCIDREFGVKDATKAYEVIAAGKAGVYFGGHWSSSGEMKSCKLNVPEAQWSCYMVPSCDDTPASEAMAVNTWGYTVAKKGAAHPEAIVKLYNLYIENLYGETGDYEHWGNDEIDGIWQMAPVRCHDPFVNLTAYRDIWTAIAEGKEQELRGVAKEYYNNYAAFAVDGDVQFWDWERMFAQEKSPFAVIDEVEKQGLIFTDAYLGAPTPTMVERMSTLDELQLNTYTKIILGELEVESGFEEFAENWIKLGGQQITEEVNAF